MDNQATQEGLDTLGQNIDSRFDRLEKKLDTKIDSKFKRLEHKLDKKIDNKFERLEQKLDKKFEEVLYHFDAVAENIHQDVAGANADEISLIKQKQENLESRVCTVEEKIGS